MSLSLSPLVLWLVGETVQSARKSKAGTLTLRSNRAGSSPLEGATNRTRSSHIRGEGETEGRRQRIASQLYGRVANAFRAVLDVCVRGYWWWFETVHLTAMRIPWAG